MYLNDFNLSEPTVKTNQYYKREHDSSSFDQLMTNWSLVFWIATCLSGWVHGNESCYKFVSTPATWRVAQGTCRDMGGSLAVLDSARKNAFVTGYMLAHGESSLL